MESVDPYLAVRKGASIKGKEPEQTSALSTAGTDPSPSEAAPVSPAPPPGCVASSTIASASEIKLPDSKAVDPKAWNHELAEAASLSTAARDELKYIRTAMNSYSTYTMDNKRFCAQRASMLYKQGTGRGLNVTDETILSGVFHEEQPITRDAQHLPEPAAPIQEEPTAIDALTNFHLIHGMRILDCVDETSNERLAIFMVKYHGGYVKALSVMAQSISDYPSSVELNSVEIEKDQLRFARLFVVKLGGYKNAVGNIRELQRVDQLQKSGNEDALKTTGMQSAALTAALDMTPTTETTTDRKSTRLNSSHWE